MILVEWGLRPPFSTFYYIRTKRYKIQNEVMFCEDFENQYLEGYCINSRI